MMQRILTSIRNPEPWQRTLWIMFIVQFTSAVGFSSIFPFLPLYVTSLDSRLGLSPEFLAGLVFSSQAVTMMFTSPFWGAVADRYGRKLMVQRATFGGAVLVTMMGFVTSAEQLILLRAVQGAVTGVISAVNALVASAAPRERTGFAMGVVQVGLSSGVAFGPFIGGVLADLFGYSTAFVITGFLLLVAGGLVSWGVQEDVTPDTRAKHAARGMFGEWNDILHSPGVVLTYTLNFLTTLCRVMIIPIAPLFIVTILPATASVNTFTGLVIGVFAAASTVTGVLLGRLGDRLGHREVLMFSSLVAGLFFVPQTFVTAGWQLLILQALAGAAAGGIVPALGALLARYTRPGEEGSVFGIDNSIRAASRAVAPLLGAGIAAWFGLRITFAATGFMFVVAAVVAMVLLPKTVHSSAGPVSGTGEPGEAAAD